MVSSELSGYLGGYGGPAQARTRHPSRAWRWTSSYLSSTRRTCKPDVIMAARSPSGDVYIPYQLPSPQKHLSTPPDAEDGIIPWGFGFEFEHCLQEKLEDERKREEARLGRYGRFGMDADDARQTTPVHMREAYCRWIKSELADVHTPSPPPSPESIPHHPAQSIKNNGSTLSTRNDGQRSGKQKKHGNTASKGIKKRQRRRPARFIQDRPSTHSMVTRSRKRRLYVDDTRSPEPGKTQSRAPDRTIHGT